MFCLRIVEDFFSQLTVGLSDSEGLFFLLALDGSANYLMATWKQPNDSQVRLHGESCWKVETRF